MSTGAQCPYIPVLSGTGIKRTGYFRLDRRKKSVLVGG